MKTAEEREKHLRDELAALLRRHQCDMVLTDDGKPYGMQSPVLRFELDSIWDDDGNQLAEYCDFEY